MSKKSTNKKTAEINPLELRQARIGKHETLHGIKISKFTESMKIESTEAVALYSGLEHLEAAKVPIFDVSVWSKTTGEMPPPKEGQIGSFYNLVMFHGKDEDTIQARVPNVVLRHMEIIDVSDEDYHAKFAKDQAERDKKHYTITIAVKKRDLLELNISKEKFNKLAKKYEDVDDEDVPEADQAAIDEYMRITDFNKKAVINNKCVDLLEAMDAQFEHLVDYRNGYAYNNKSGLDGTAKSCLFSTDTYYPFLDRTYSVENCPDKEKAGQPRPFPLLRVTMSAPDAINSSKSPQFGNMRSSTVYDITKTNEEHSAFLAKGKTNKTDPELIELFDGRKYSNIPETMVAEPPLEEMLYNGRQLDRSNAKDAIPRRSTASLLVVKFGMCLTSNKISLTKKGHCCVVDFSTAQGSGANRTNDEDKVEDSDEDELALLNLRKKKAVKAAQAAKENAGKNNKAQPAKSTGTAGKGKGAGKSAIVEKSGYESSEEDDEDVDEDNDEEEKPKKSAKKAPAPAKKPTKKVESPESSDDDEDDEDADEESEEEEKPKKSAKKAPAKKPIKKVESDDEDDVDEESEEEEKPKKSAKKATKKPAYASDDDEYDD